MNPYKSPQPVEDVAPQKAVSFKLIPLFFIAASFLFGCYSMWLLYSGVPHEDRILWAYIPVTLWGTGLFIEFIRQQVEKRNG